MLTNRTYLVSYHDSIPLIDILNLGIVAYRCYPFFCLEHSEDDFLSLVCEEYRDTPALVCTCDGIAVVGICLSEKKRDSHIRGIGRDVLFKIAHPDHNIALIKTNRAFLELLKNDGSDWYCQNHRLDENNYITTVRRLHGKESKESCQKDIKGS